MGGDTGGRANFGESRGKDSVSPTLDGVFFSYIASESKQLMYH